MNLNQINKMVTTYDREGLTALTDETSGEYLINKLEEFEREYDLFDVDQTLKLGAAFANAGHQNADGAILQWLADHPAARRLEIVSVLLRTLWMNARHGASISPQKVTTLLNIRSGLVLDETAGYEYTLTLCAVLESKLPSSLRRRIVELLLLVRQQGFAYMPYDRLARVMIERALRQVDSDE